uniref:Uncharacterized protein n=1 Tax=Sphaerodactylus townsendi TaxID=933632 RepID=A0ACB8F4B9_9SAUR
MITALLRKLKQQSRESVEEKRPRLLKALKELGDFYLELHWDFQSWVPLLSRILPSDACKIYKQGINIRLDTTLIDFTDMKCQRGDLSFIFNGDAAPSESFVVLDNEQKVYQRIHHEESEMETEEEVDILMSSDIYSATLSTKSITFTRAQTGWLFREDKTERVGNFLADFYLVNGLVLESRKRREHLSEEDILRNKAIMESLSKGGNLMEQNFEPVRRQSLTPPPPNTITWEEYISAENGKAPHLGRELVCKESKKTFKATIAMSQEFPLGIESFTRSTAEGTHAAKSASSILAPTAAAQVEPPAKKKATHKNKTVSGIVDAPAHKRLFDQTTAGSLAPSEGVADYGGSSTSSSYAMRDSESPVFPPSEEVIDLGPSGDAASRQDSVPRGEGVEMRGGVSQQPDPAAEAIAAWQHAPPAAFAHFLREEIDRVLAAREKHTAITLTAHKQLGGSSAQVDEGERLQYRNLLDFPEEEEDSSKGEEVTGGDRFSDSEETTLEATEQSPKFFKLDDLQMLITKSISAYLQDQEGAVDLPTNQDLNMAPSKPIKGFPKGKADYFPQEQEGEKYFPVPEYFV